MQKLIEFLELKISNFKVDASDLNYFYSLRKDDKDINVKKKQTRNSDSIKEDRKPLTDLNKKLV